METGFQSSFIPKKPIVSTGGGQSRSSVSLLMIIAVIIFVATLASAGFTFIYGNSLTSKIEESKAYLKQQEDAFDTNTIKRMVRMDGRIEAGKSILATHVAPSAIFNLIEESTLSGIRFKSFDYSSSGEKPTISMKGQADSFTAIALQSDEFSRHKEFKEPLLSDLSLDNSGSVSFNFTSGVDPNIILYSRVSGKK